MPSICLITALPAEARPLITYFGMRAIGHSHLRLHQGESAYLLQCGVGKLNAAARTAAMLQSLPDVVAIINVGIAGSDRTLGETLLAHGVQDQASAQQWFPHLPAVNRLPDVASIQVCTVDKPSSNYTQELAFDMEASGIFNAASKVLDLAFVHCVKVVSDNAESTLDTITAKSASASIKEAIPTVEKLMHALPFDALPSTSAVEALSHALTNRVHYTATERHSLKQLLHRYNALFNEVPNAQALEKYNNAKDIRKMLLSKIDSAAVTY